MGQNPESLAKRVEQIANKPGLPTVDNWHPDLSGDMDLRITRDGRWIHKGAPLAREAIVRLFSTILRREEDGEYYLVSPVEKWRIQVEDTPLLAHTLTVEGEGADQVVRLTTNVGEVLEVGEEHPLDVGTYPGSEEPRPVVHVRNGVEARLVTAAYYDLAAHATEQEVNGKKIFGVFSRGNFYKIG